jgi:hypothetical protein
MVHFGNIPGGEEIDKVIQAHKNHPVAEGETLKIARRRVKSGPEEKR